MKTFLEISISASQSQQELLIPTMVELGCQGFQEQESSLLCYIEKSRWSDEKYGALKEELKKLLQTISSNTHVAFREIVEENWNEQWERSLQPIEIGKRLVIKPSWSSYENKNGRTIILIDPKMSFGTGYHESTRLTLQLLEKYVSHGCSVLDVGTGTGVLAIAAVKLGAKSALGIDIDEWSIENAKENVVANDVVGKVTISSEPLSHLHETLFDVITANLTLNTNRELLPQFHALLRTKGVVIVSGLLRSDEQTMTNHLKEQQFTFLEECTENEWIAIAAQKN